MSLVLFDVTSRAPGRPTAGETPSGGRPPYPVVGGAS